MTVAALCLILSICALLILLAGLGEWIIWSKTHNQIKILNEKIDTLIRSKLRFDAPLEVQELREEQDKKHEDFKT